MESGSFIFDTLVLISVITLLLFTLVLRQVLARIFPTISARIVQATVPSGIADLHQTADAELVKLGFEGPVWVMLESTPAHAGLFRFCAVYRHKQEATLAWLFPPSDANMPNRLLTYWTTALADHRTVISQAFDPFFELLQTTELPAQTIDGQTLEEQLEQHKAYRQKFNQQAAADATSDKAITDMAAGAMNRQQEAMVEQGKLYRDSNGEVRASFLMGLKIFWRVLTRKQAKDPQKPIPTPRLVMLANITGRIRRMNPGITVQLGLFAFSVILSAILGAVIWDLQFAIMILLVILFHELGHFLAMRSFGYRNVHMLALPLVGGVTIGMDEENSATNRAWMSLMGPLPGIMVGWIFIYMAYQQSGGIFDGWLGMLAMLLLIINYLNLIPMLPLDGGHVLQALLPPRWVNIQAIVLAVTCIIGLVGSVMIGFYIIAFLATLQLFTLKNHFQTGKVIQLLTHSPAQPEKWRLSQVLKALEEVAGPATKAQQRINQAEQILSTLNTTSMSWSQRSLIGTLYAALLVVPILAGVLMLWATLGMENLTNITAHTEKINQLNTQLEEQASQMSMAELVQAIQELSPDSKDQPPASDEAIAATEQRLGISLPKELRDFYHTSDGSAVMDIQPVAQIESASITFQRIQQQQPLEEALHLSSFQQGEWTEQQIPLEQAQGWLTIGQNEQWEGYTFIDPNTPAAIPGKHLFSYSEGMLEAYPDLRDMVSKQWQAIQSSRQIQQWQDTQTAQIKQTLTDKSMDSLLQEFKPASLLLMLLSPLPEWPEGVDLATLEAFETELGKKLPPDLRELYQLHNGFPPLQLFSLEEIGQWKAETGSIILQNYPDGIALQDNTLLENHVTSHCLLIGGMIPVYQDTDENNDNKPYPTLLWCPQAEIPNQRIIDLNRNHGYSSFDDLLRQTVAQRKAIMG